MKRIFNTNKIILVALLSLIVISVFSGCSKAKKVEAREKEQTCTEGMSFEEVETTTTISESDESTTEPISDNEVVTSTTMETQVTTTAPTTTATTTVKKTTAKKISVNKKQQATTKKVVEDPTKYANADISAWINETGGTVVTRFKVPKGYTRVQYEAGSYAEYVRNLPLKAYGTKMYEYNGKLVENQSWCASVIKTEFHSRGWLQCADCVMQLVGDYLYGKGRYNDIVFQLSGGSKLKFGTWAGGDYSRSKYLSFMSSVYCSANTYSLMSQSESVKMNIKDIFPGAYFIMKKDSKHLYGHAVYVIDVAKNAKGDVAFLLAQGSTPSQDMHIFLNPLHPDDPWYYSNEIGSSFAIPFWTFSTSNLYYYKHIGMQKGTVVEETVAPTTTVVPTTETQTTTEEQTTTEVETTTEIQTTTDEHTTTETQATTEEITTTRESEVGESEVEKQETTE